MLIAGLLVMFSFSFVDIDVDLDKKIQKKEPKKEAKKKEKKEERKDEEENSYENMDIDFSMLEEDLTDLAIGVDGLALGTEKKSEKDSKDKKDKDGDNVVMIETYKKHQPPSETAAAMLLRNYDKDWQDNDSAAKRLKEQELELKKAIAKATNFDLEI